VTEFDCFEHELIDWLLRDRGVKGERFANTALTGLLLLAHPAGVLRSQIRSAAGKGNVLDEALIVSLAKRARRPLALRILCTAAARDASGTFFAQLFDLIVPELERCSREERLTVAECLVGRINFWPVEADAYAPQIRILLHDSGMEIASGVIPTLSKLSRVTTEDIARLTALTGRASTRLNAVSALAAVLERGTFPVEELGPRFWSRIAKLAACEDSWIGSGVARILALKHRSGHAIHRDGRVKGHDSARERKARRGTPPKRR
jgi:hypothetical protein